MTKHNILIVDDSATTRMMVKRILTLCGIANENISEAADGSQALARLVACPVDLVIADLHMPNMGGLELTTRILASSTLRHIPVVIVSADPNADRIDQLKQSGVKGYLAKPFTPESFKMLLMQVLPEAA